VGARAEGAGTRPHNGLMPETARLDESWTLGTLSVPNRVLLAPLAGIGNWFVRLQAKRYGAGMAVSEMVSSHAIHHRNEKTCTEMLRIDPREREGGPVSIQLFGEDPAVMREAAAVVVARGADAIDINMGCPVPKVRKTGAGAALLDDPDLAVRVARATVEGANDAVGAGGREVPVTVKLRSGVRPGEQSGFELAHRLVAEAGVAAIGFHPRSAAVHHKGAPDYELAARLVRSLPAPVILTGGMDDADAVRGAFASTGAAAVMLARGALGNPWLFAELLDPEPGPHAEPGAHAEADGHAEPDGHAEADARTEEHEHTATSEERGPTREQVLAELEWTIERAVEHLGEQRATRYLRKFYPWYVPRLRLQPPLARSLQEALQTAEELPRTRELLDLACRPSPALV
jgi:tRNA-dihydrouridine synthase B